MRVHSFILLFISVFLTASYGKTQQVPQWKPLGPFYIHKQTGETSAPGLGVFRTVDVSAKDPSRILIGGMSSGVWLSEDKGKSWKNVTLNLPVENVKKLEISASDNKIVYAATTVGVIKSTDAGRTWKFTTLNLLAKLPCPDREKWSDDRTLLSVSPKDPNTVIASAADTIYKTTDGGKTWKNILADFQTQYIFYHPTKAQIVYLGGAYKKARNRFCLLRSENGGDGFTETTQGIPDQNKLVQLTDITAPVSPAAPDKFYELIFGNAKVKTTLKGEEKSQMVGTFLVSEDAGKSFQLVPQVNNYRYIDDYFSLFYPYSQDEDKAKYDFDYKDSSFWQASFQQVGWATSFAISNTDPNTMVMAASGAVLSKDGGHAWEYLRKQGSYAMHGDLQQAKIIRNDVWLVNDGGVYYVDLNDRRPKRIEGFSGQDLWGFSTSFKSDVMAIGVDHSGLMIYDSKLYGNEWYHSGGGDAMSSTVNLFDDRYIYGTPYDHYVIKRPSTLRDEQKMRKSTMHFGYIPNRNVEFHANLAYTIYGIYENSDHRKINVCSIVKTADNMNTIDTLKVFPPGQYLKRVRVEINSADYIYAITSKPAQVWMSADEGKTWKEITPPNKKAVQYGFTDLAISDMDPRHVFLSVGGFQNEVKLLYSTDAGQSWQDYYSSALPKNEIMTMALQRGTNEGIYLGCTPGVYYRSRDMNQWKEVGRGLPYTAVNFISLNYDKAKIRIGTYRGLWECDLAEDFKPRALIAMNKNSLPSGQSDERKVFFYDHSAIMGKGASWYWEFPGSVQGTSTDENPIIDYETAIPGKYSVRLTITDRKGRKSFCELKDFIEVRNNEPWNLRTIKLEKEADEPSEEE